MSWKNTLPFFAWQNLRFSRKMSEFKHNWVNYDRWMNSFKPGRNSVNDESAWITFDALDYLSAWLRPEHRVFEFGGGGSTLFFCKKTASVVTVEHHREWFETLEKVMQEKGYSNWQGYFVESDLVADWHLLDAANPKHFRSNSPDQKNRSFERYARMIAPFDDGFFDLVLVDGRARTSCIAQAIPKVKTGGLLVVDNSERPYYLPAFKEVFAQQFKVELDTYAPVPYSPDFSTTLILRKL